MAFNAEVKAEIVKDFGRKPNDTGSPETQVALLTNRIAYLTDHVKKNSHDFHTRRGLVFLVSKRRKLLKYLKNTDLNRYRTLIERLSLRDSF